MRNRKNVQAIALENRRRTVFAAYAFLTAAVLLLLAIQTYAQEPKPGPERTVSIPAVKEAKLKNGLTVAVVEKRGVPLVTVQLLLRSGAADEPIEKAGLADLTASMLTKGTKTRTAEQIAQEMEFLGGSINSGAGWNSSSVTVSVTSDKLDQAMAIMSDVVLNPTFPQAELELLRSQAIDGLTYNLTQPGFLANYVASRFSFSEHPSQGTEIGLRSIGVKDVREFYNDNYVVGDSVLIFAGDITQQQAVRLAAKYFSVRPKSETIEMLAPASIPATVGRSYGKSRILVIDLPNSGQAAVVYATPVNPGRISCYPEERTDQIKCEGEPDYYPASALNSLLGGGYSSRLNQEIRIKRGLSYGAGSSFAWRHGHANFFTRTQTKNESAPEVAELVLAEINKLANHSIAAAELDPRKAVLTGGFSRNIETTGGLVNALADLYTFDIPTSELNKYMPNVNAVTDKQIRDFAKANLLGGDIVIVGDYAKFKDDLAKRFPSVKPEVIPAAELDITKPNLRK